MYPDMFQILFNLYGYEDVYAGSDNFTWLTQYQNGEGSMVGHMEKAVENFRKLFDDGVLSLDSLELSPSERSEMLYKDHSTAMIIECQNAVTYSQAITEDSEENMHEYAMMPFWTSDEKNGDFLYTIPSYYMAINKKSAEESEEKKEILLKIYRYLSSVEGQKTLIGDNFQLSNILGVTMNSNDFSEGIISTIERGQAINTFYLAAGETNKQVERQMLSTVGDMVQGKISVEDWLLGADEVRDKYLAGELDETEVLGSSKSTLTRLQTAYTVADMYRTLMDVPIGICFGGAWEKSTNGYLYKGDITAASLACIEPDKEVQADSDEEVDDRIVTSYLTGQQIIDILNSGDVEIETKGLYPYYVAAGLEVEFNPWAKEGNRVISCKLPDGENLDLNELYEVAYFNGSLPDDMDAELEDILPMTWQEAFVKWLNDNDGVVEKPDMTITLSYE